MKRPKLMILGDAGHGKDTVAEILRSVGGYQFESSSHAAMRIAIFEPLAAKYGYANLDECYADRVNHRAEWYDLITAFNTPDKTRLAREILSTNDIYVGMRHHAELSACKEQKLVDYIFWVDAYPRVRRESNDSMTVKQHQADWVIPNKGTEAELTTRVINIWRGFLHPWELRLNNPKRPDNAATQVVP